MGFGRFLDGNPGSIFEIRCDECGFGRGDVTGVCVEEVAQHERLRCLDLPGFSLAERCAHPAVGTHVPRGRVTRICGMIVEGDALDDGFSLRPGAGGDGTRVVHPCGGLFEDRFLAAGAFAARQLSAAEMMAEALRDANREESEIRLLERGGFPADPGTQGDLDLEKLSSDSIRRGGGDQFVIDQLRACLVIPAERGGEDRLRIAILVGEPVFLTDPRLRVLRPEIDSLDLRVGKPDRAVMIVILRSGMSQARQ